MKNKPSIWAYMLIFNFLGLFLFYVWIINPMWYSKVGHHYEVGIEVPFFHELDNDTKQKFTEYVKSLNKKIEEKKSR